MFAGGGGKREGIWGFPKTENAKLWWTARGGGYFSKKKVNGVDSW